MAAADKLAVKLTSAGISRVVFIRHANAAPPGSKAKGEYGTIHDWQRDDQVLFFFCLFAEIDLQVIVACFAVAASDRKGPQASRGCSRVVHEGYRSCY
jgi:hypothetical protein